MKCIIVDDEPLAHQVLAHYISLTPGFELTAKFRNPVEAFEYLSTHRTDLLFLDIEMPLVTGLHFLSVLPDPPQTIFTTAYKQYAYEGFELSAADYLLKPFSFERFTKAINKVVRKSAIPPPESPALSIHTLLIKHKGSLLNLNQQDIRYIEGCKDYIKISAGTETYIIYHTLKGILDKLNPQTFIQIHRSYIVNKTYINRIHQDALILHDQIFIPIGPNYRRQLLDELNK